MVLDRNAPSIVELMRRMRGIVLKFGQMLSIQVHFACCCIRLCIERCCAQDENVLPTNVQEIFNTVRCAFLCFLRTAIAGLLYSQRSSACDARAPAVFDLGERAW